MKFSREKIVQIIKEEMENVDHGHHEIHDNEGKMAKSQLFQLAKYSSMLHDALKEEDQLESWVQSKITKAVDYISKVKHYLEYEMGLDFDEGVEMHHEPVAPCPASPQQEPENYIYEVDEDFSE